MSWLWALLPLVVGAAHAGDAIYKSVGPDGKVVYSQTPPADGKLDKKRCGYCRQAQAWLAAQKVPYQNMDIDTPEGMSEFVLTGKGSVPLLLGPGIKVRGFSAPAYSAALAKPGR